MGGRVWKIQVFEECTLSLLIYGGQIIQKTNTHFFWVESRKTNSTIGKFYQRGFIWMVTGWKITWPQRSLGTIWPVLDNRLSYYWTWFQFWPVTKPNLKVHGVILVNIANVTSFRYGTVNVGGEITYTCGRTKSQLCVNANTPPEQLFQRLQNNKMEQKPQLQSVLIIHKFVYPYVLSFLFRVLFSRSWIFWALVSFMFHSISRQLSLFEFWSISWQNPGL